MCNREFSFCCVSVDNLGEEFKCKLSCVFAGMCRTGYAYGCPGSVMRMRIPPTNCTPWSHTFLSPHAKVNTLLNWLSFTCWSNKDISLTLHDLSLFQQVCRQSMLMKTKFVPSASGINETKGLFVLSLFLILALEYVSLIWVLKGILRGFLLNLELNLVPFFWNRNCLIRC